MARLYCRQLGEQDVCEMAVSLSHVSTRGTPIGWRLYLPTD